MAQQFLQGADMHSPHGQVRSVGMVQIVKAEIIDARPPASRSEAVLNVRNRFAVPENITGLLRHLGEDSIKRFIDREIARGIIFGYMQNDKADYPAGCFPIAGLPLAVLTEGKYGLPAKFYGKL